MVKPRSQQLSITKKQEIDSTIAESLADKLADKPYGQQLEPETQSAKKEIKDTEIERITISIPRWMSYRLEDMARERKRSKQQNRTVSAIVREALDMYFDESKK